MKSLLSIVTWGGGYFFDFLIYYLARRRSGRIQAGFPGEPRRAHLRPGGRGEQLPDGHQGLHLDDQGGVREGLHGAGPDDGGV